VSALTKILIVLQLVFSLVVSVLLVLYVSKAEEPKKQAMAEHTQFIANSAALDKTNQMLAAKNAEVTALNTQVTNLNGAIVNAQNDTATARAEKVKADAALVAQSSTSLQVQEKLASLTASQEERLAALTEDLKKLREQVPSLTKEKTDLSRVVLELRSQLDAANVAIKQYQVILANNGGSNGAGVNMKPQVSEMETHVAAAPVNGTVTDVATSAGRVYIETKLGARDGIQVGTKLLVYRGNGYVGDVQVESVSPDTSVAVVVATKAGETVQKGDYVATVGGN